MLGRFKTLRAEVIDPKIAGHRRPPLKSRFLAAHPARFVLPTRGRRIAGAIRMRKAGSGALSGA
jgi:hypothetical protein